MACSSLARNFAKESVVLGIKTLMTIVPGEEFGDGALFQLGVEGAGRNVLKIDVFFVELPGDGITVIEPVEPSFFPSHKTIGRMLGGKVRVLGRKELKFVKRNCVSNRPRRECEGTCCTANDGQLEPIQNSAISKHEPCRADPAADQ